METNILGITTQKQVLGDLPIQLSKINLPLSNPLKDKEIKILNSRTLEDIISYEGFLEKNKLHSKKIEENQKVFSQLKTKIKTHIYNVTQEAMLMQIQLKKTKYFIEDLKGDLEIFYELTKDFNQFYEMFKQSKMMTIQIPSAFLIMQSQKISNKIDSLKNKVNEMEELINLSINEANENEYEFLINLIEEFYHNYHSVSFLVLSFNEHYKTFRNKILDVYKERGDFDIDKRLEFETRELNKDNIIANLTLIGNKLEEKKKIDRKEKIKQKV